MTFHIGRRPIRNRLGGVGVYQNQTKAFASRHQLESEEVVAATSVWLYGNTIGPEYESPNPKFFICELGLGSELHISGFFQRYRFSKVPCCGFRQLEVLSPSWLKSRDVFPRR